MFLPISLVLLSGSILASSLDPKYQHPISKRQHLQTLKQHYLLKSSEKGLQKTTSPLYRWFSRYVIAAMLVDENKRFLISSFCSSTSNCTLQHCYLSP